MKYIKHKYLQEGAGGDVHFNKSTCKEGLGVKYITDKYLTGRAWGEVHYTQVPARRGLG